VGDTGKRVREVLRDKHPPATSPEPGVLLSPDPEDDLEVHPVLFDRLDGDLIRAAAMRVQGSAGPSGVDSCGWRRLCTAFGQASVDLCSALAAFGRRLCIDDLPFSTLSAYVGCRLIPLDKQPGVRPIGVCEVVRRIVGKAVLMVISNDIQSAAGTLQLCAGQPAGIEAAIHAAHQLYNDDTTEALLLVDASNAFNQLNRQAALHNIAVLCPPLAKVLQNTYRGHADLFVGGEVLASQEGTTQGDPLAMCMYAIGILPLIRELWHSQAKQFWFADDATGGGTLPAVKRWWDHLNAHGPGYGYFPNAGKTWLLVKPSAADRAHELFGATGIRITSEGRRLLGACLGTATSVHSYVQHAVGEFVDQVNLLSKVAATEPHAAHTAFTRGLAGKWTFLSRTMGDISELFRPLEIAIRERFIPALTGRPAPHGAFN